MQPKFEKTALQIAVKKIFHVRKNVDFLTFFPVFVQICRLLFIPISKHVTFFIRLQGIFEPLNQIPQKFAG